MRAVTKKGEATDLIEGGRKEVGASGEKWARQYLQRAGYRILHTNWRGKSGEIDLIVQKSDKLVFVEVRTRRRGSAFGLAKESVDHRKQTKIRRTAELYLAKHDLSETLVQFDVIAVEYDEHDVQIEHIEQAF